MYLKESDELHHSIGSLIDGTHPGPKRLSGPLLFEDL